jgi:uncharacterized membrane protein YkvI
MGTGRAERLVPLAGVLFAVVFAVGLALGDTPDSTASGQEVISHCGDEGKSFSGIMMLLVAAVLFMFYAGRSAPDCGLPDRNG